LTNKEYIWGLNWLPKYKFKIKITDKRDICEVVCNFDTRTNVTTNYIFEDQNGDFPFYITISYSILYNLITNFKYKNMIDWSKLSDFKMNNQFCEWKKKT
jgi:hypothetical protein